MKLSDLPRRVVQPLGEWPVEEGHLSACARYREKNREACRARVRVTIDGLTAENAELRSRISDGMPKWRDTDTDPPDDEQTVLACWKGSSCIEGMETLIYRAADGPGSPERWQNVHGEKRDAPTHWTLLEGPK